MSPLKVRAYLDDVTEVVPDRVINQREKTQPAAHIIKLHFAVHLENEKIFIYSPARKELCIALAYGIVQHQ